MCVWTDTALPPPQTLIKVRIMIVVNFDKLLLCQYKSNVYLWDLSSAVNKEKKIESDSRACPFFNVVFDNFLLPQKFIRWWLNICNNFLTYLFTYNFIYIYLFTWRNVDVRRCFIETSLLLMPLWNDVKYLFVSPTSKFKLTDKLW